MFFTPNAGFGICHLRAKVIRHACAPEHEAGNAVIAVGALFHRIGVIRKLAGLEIVVQIERPVSACSPRPACLYVRGEWYQIAVGVAFLADFRVHIRIAGVKRYQALALAYPDRNVPAFPAGIWRFCRSDGIVSLVESSIN